MATMITQANGMHIPPVIQQLGVKIPYLEGPHQNEGSFGNDRALTVNHHAQNTRNSRHILMEAEFRLISPTKLMQTAAITKMNDHAM